MKEGLPVGRQPLSGISGHGRFALVMSAWRKETAGIPPDNNAEACHSCCGGIRLFQRRAPRRQRVFEKTTGRQDFYSIAEIQ